MFWIYALQGKTLKYSRKVSNASLLNVLFVYFQFSDSFHTILLVRGFWISYNLKLKGGLREESFSEKQINSLIFSTKFSNSEDCSNSANFSNLLYYWDPIWSLNFETLNCSNVIWGEQFNNPLILLIFANYLKHLLKEENFIKYLEKSLCLN